MATITTISQENGNKFHAILHYSGGHLEIQACWTSSAVFRGDAILAALNLAAVRPRLGTDSLADWFFPTMHCLVLRIASVRRARSMHSH